MNIHGGVSARCFITPSTTLRLLRSPFHPVLHRPGSSSEAASINMQRHIELCLSSESRASHVLADVREDDATIVNCVVARGKVDAVCSSTEYPRIV